MIDAWNLVWIIIVVACVCFAFGVWLASGKACDEQVAKDTANEHDGAWPSGDKCATCPYNPHPPDDERG